MSRSWWKKLFGRKDSSARPVTKAKLNLHGTRLEDRLAPATLTDSGSTLTITLDNANEQVGIVSNGSTYDFTSTNNFVNGGVAAAGDFSAFGATNLTMNASGLTRYSFISVVDSTSGTSVSFNDSGANAYSDRFSINLNNGSNALLFNGATNFGASDFATFVSGTITVNAGAAVSNTGGKTMTLQADGQVINGAVSATGAGGRIQLVAGAVGVSANLGSAAAGFNFSQAELDNLTTPTLEIFAANGINIASPVTLASAKIPTLYLNSSFAGGITDGTVGEQTDLTVDNLRIASVGGIGAADDLNISVKTLSFNNTAGAVQISNAGALIIGSVAGSTSSDNTGTTTNISATSPITIATDLISAGDITLTAGEISDGPTFADDLTINAGIKVQSTGGNVTLQAGDDIFLNNLSVVQADTAGKLITLTAGFNDLDGSGAIAAIGTPSIVATNLGMSAINGVGSLANPIVTTVSNLEASTTTGGIFISNTGTLNIGGVSAAIEGVQATTSGDIQLINTDSIILAGTSTEDIRTESGNVLVQAQGATSDVDVRNDSADAIDSNNGNVTLDAGRDILLGSPTTDNFGDVEANGDVVLLAGRDIIIDENTDIQAFGIGTIVATAGGNVSLLASDGTIGSSLATAGGTITITTGAGGIFTHDAGASGSIKTTDSGGNGDITINADNIVIASPIDAGTECVVLQAVTAGAEFDLGGAGGAGTIGLTDAELDFISAGILQIGNATAGPINVTAAISLAAANVPVLDLRTGSSVNDAGGTLDVASLVFDAGTSFVLTGINTIGTVAGTANTTIQLWSAGKMEIGSVVNCDGVTINGLDSNNNNIQIVVDDLEISQQLNAGTADLVIAPFTGGLINLGTEVVGSLSLTGLEVAQITAGRLQIGTNLSGAITVDGPVAPTMLTHLNSGGSITGAGSVTTTELSLTSGDSVALTGANDVDTLAGFSTGDFEFTDVDDLDIGTVAAISVTEIGVTSLASHVLLNAGALLNLTNDVNASAGNVRLNTTSVGVTQTTGNVLAVGLEFLGTGTFTLTSAANDVTTLAGNVTGAINYRDANAITIGTVNTVGISTSGNSLTLQADGINQTALLAASVFSITGNGNFFLGHSGNDVTSFTANTTGGQVVFRDANNLSIAAGGIKTGGQSLSILTGNSFTLAKGVTIDVGADSGGVTAGLNDASKADKSTTVTLNGTVIAHPANGFRLDGGIGSNTFVVTPSTTTPIFVFGNSPVVAELSPAIRGDALSLQTSSLSALIGLNNFNPANGSGAFTFTDPNNGAVEKARPVIFNSIENIKGLSMEAAAVQTASNNYQLIAAGYLNGQPFRGGFSGTLPPVAPFLISPQLVSPQGPFTAPRISVGDVDADGLPDLIVGFGRNSGSPLVTVVRGTRIFDASKAGLPLSTADIMTQFYAYNPMYQGGVYVSAADLNGDGRAEIITGAGESGGPHVKVFSIDASKSANSNATVVGEFFAYAANFNGGVRVAAGDVNGDGQVDIVTAAGIGGGPHVKVFSGAGATSGPGTPTIVSEFFAYAANFNGGVYVDAGDYDGDGFADILTGAGFGGGPHVRVFDGENLSKFGAVTVLNEFFDDPPTGTNPSPLQDDQSALSAGVSGVGFGNFDDTDSVLDIFVGSGIGRRTRVRIYKNGSHEPVRDALNRPVDFASGGTNYLFDNRRDGANVAVGGAFVS